MNPLFDHGLSTGSALLLFVCLAIALGFEFVNGFHDTANAVATVIYTHALKPTAAVMLSAFFNFTGVLLGGISVAMGIIKLLPLDLVVAGGSGIGIATVLSLLLSAILWNLGTWYLGIPASSSHTLIGSIIGVGLANSMRAGHVFGQGINLTKVAETMLSLVISPLFGFLAAGLLLLLVKRLFGRSHAMHEPPVQDVPPPPLIRAMLIATCSGVSLAHGSNDGQKGVGLVMLILIGIVPAGFALDAGATQAEIQRTLRAVDSIEQTIERHRDRAGSSDATVVRTQFMGVRRHLAGRGRIADIPRAERFAVRQEILTADKSLEALVKRGGLGLSASEASALASDRKALRRLTDYAPSWVLIAIALSLGIGTMVGWRRIVVTVGEKIGKAHLTYAQGACAELVAASTIGIASATGLPVSTTHVLSSGIAGTMVAKGAGVQQTTIRNIAIAWVLTLPVTMLLAGVLFTLMRLAFG
ncbi:MAG: inorganic phosphate transporter [Deltaproteobacteria bacterium]|nr:inorganic phosphate transporter [Deltaproteobacteria bacterium]